MRGALLEIPSGEGAEQRVGRTRERTGQEHPRDHGVTCRRQESGEQGVRPLLVVRTDAGEEAAAGRDWMIFLAPACYTASHTCD